MNARVRVWGNSLALRIPKTLAAETHLEDGLMVDLTCIDGKLVVTPMHEPEITLESILASINPENIHSEVQTGPSVGNEAW